MSNDGLRSHPKERLLHLLHQDVIEAAKALLGWNIVTSTTCVQIVETEAYRTPDDPACHAHRGPTPRTAVMYGPPGFAYVYFTYGHHWMLNVTAHEPGTAAAVLIRAAKPISGQVFMQSRRGADIREKNLLSGPGKICQALGIDRAHNGLNLFEDPSLQLQPGVEVGSIVSGVRVGIAAGKGELLPWRFVDEAELAYSSKPHNTLS